jgi:hypothetical protein
VPVDDREVHDAEVRSPRLAQLPIVVKLCESIAHKTSRADAAHSRLRGRAVRAAATNAGGRKPDVDCLLCADGGREPQLIAGLVRIAPASTSLRCRRHPRRGRRRAVFCPVPLTRVDAEDLIDALGTQALLGPFRGEPAVDRERLADVLVGLSALATARPDVASVDVNPLIVVDGVPLAVDALVELVR